MDGFRYSGRLIACGLILCALATAGLTLMVSMARAHENWPAVCCSDRDCAEIPDSMVREEGDQSTDRVYVDIPPGAHPMWPKEKTENFRGSVQRFELKDPVKSGWGACISPGGLLLCIVRPKRFG